ncbi:MAG: hypothetical protein V1837_03145 [Candidatus Woesearchaeota archaeon]
MATRVNRKNPHYVLFTYSIDKLRQKDKVLFYYALKGRKGHSGILADDTIVQLGRTVVLVPKSKELKFSRFLRQWKCLFDKRYLVLEK